MKPESNPSSSEKLIQETISTIAGYYENPVAARTVIFSYMPRIKPHLERILNDETQMYQRRIASKTPRTVALLKHNLQSSIESTGKLGDMPTLRTPGLDDYDRIGELSGIMRESALYAAKIQERKEQFVIED